MTQSKEVESKTIRGKIYAIVKNYCWECIQNTHKKGFHSHQVDDLDSLLSSTRQQVQEEMVGNDLFEANTYQVKNPKSNFERAVTIDKVTDDKWAIRYIGDRLTRKGEWVHEPMPSSRTDEFKKKTQFTKSEAFLTLYSLLKETTK